MIEARAFWLTRKGRGALKAETLDYPGGDWCVVRAMFSAVSPGTERLVAMDRVPAALRQEMRCPYMGGRFPFPVKYGYSLVGEVVQGPAELRGRVVHVLHPHQDFCVVRAKDVRPLPAGVPPARATLASNLETAITAAWDAEVMIGERILVVGFGVVGSLVARVLALGPAFEVTVAETRPDRRRLAESLGFRVAEGRGEGHFDLAFDTSGAAAGLRSAVESVGLEGRVVAVSWFGTAPVPLDLGGTFHSRRKRIIGSQVSRLPGGLGPRWDTARRTELVFRLLERPEFDLHVGPAVSFTELPKTYGSLVGRRPQGLSPLIIY
ncbi:MAG TPA: zinc-binding alcohol dehydrogenase [Candidatus Bathyarchaeia archaeon]|nr:zinc-binding alcohol dehydrogenase [Candidatus Bathyarchaeia archaeon]